MKNKFIMATFFSVFLLSTSSAKAATFTDNQTVDANKTWTIKFTSEVGLDDISKQGIFVTDSKGNAVPVGLELGENNKTVVVKSPTDGYTAGENYTLNVGSKTHSSKGTALKNEYAVHFNIKSENNVPKIEEVLPGSEPGTTIVKTGCVSSVDTTPYTVLVGGTKLVYNEESKRYEAIVPALYNSIANAQADTVVNSMIDDIENTVTEIPSYYQQLVMICGAAYNDLITPAVWTYSKQQDPGSILYGKHYTLSNIQYIKSYSYLTGFYAMVVKNKLNGEYIIAFRGTDNKVDYITDAVDVVGGAETLQVPFAVAAVKQFIDEYRDAKFTLVGHSLGGFLAAWVGTEIMDHNIDTRNLRAVYTFNAPGLTPPPLSSTDAENKIHRSNYYGVYLSFINFIIPDDIIGTFGYHLGSVWPFEPNNGPFLKDPFCNHGIELFLKGNSQYPLQSKPAREPSYFPQSYY